MATASPPDTWINKQTKQTFSSQVGNTRNKQVNRHVASFACPEGLPEGYLKSPYDVLQVVRIKIT